MSALTEDAGFRFTTLVEAQRGMTDAEADQFLLTGVMPDLSLPPDETKSLDEIIRTDAEARDLLAGFAGFTASGRDNFLAQSKSHSDAFKFNPNQPRDEDGKWGDGTTTSVAKKLTKDEITERGKRLDKILKGAEKLGTSYTHGKWLGPTKGVMWNTERDAVHREIVDDLYAKAASVPNNGQSIIMGGPAGAGKTTTVRDHAGVNLNDYLIVNPDDMKEELATRGLIPEIPGHPELTPMERSTLVHLEAMRIASMLAKKAYADKKNIIWDITMGTVTSTASHVNALRQHGYSDVSAIVVDVPPDVSRRRAYRRYGEDVNNYLAGKGHGGRYIPRKVLMDQHNGSGTSWGRQTLRQLRDKFDRWEIYDNSVDGGTPKLMKKSGD